MNQIILERISTANNRVDYYFECKGITEYFDQERHLFFEYNYNVNDTPNSILSIPFVANIIPLTWLTDATLVVPELDLSFFKCLSKVKAAYQRMFPNIELKGSLQVHTLVENSYVPEHEAATLFSGGLDALTTFIRIKDKNPFLITEYGWHGNEIQPSDVWEADKSNAVSFAKIHELDNILIQSNYGTFIKAQAIDRDYRTKLGDTWWHGLHHGLAIISAAIPIAYYLKIKCVYIASSDPTQHLLPCASSPTVDNEIKYASGSVQNDGSELTRQDKVKVMVNYYSKEKVKANVRVCFKKEKNCNKCEKCLRTMMGIIAEGHDPRDYGFKADGDFSAHLKKALDEEVKFFSDTFIQIYWKKIQERMRENESNIKIKDLLDWFLNYDFIKERKKSLLRYRVTNFFPIVTRKVTNLFG